MTKEPIVQLRALGIPDWATARRMMNQAADAIEALQARVAELEIQAAEFHMAYRIKCDKETKALTVERDALAAELAAARAQEPSYLLTPDGKCYAYGDSPPLSAGHADATLLKLYAAPTPPVREPTPISQAVRDYNEVVDKYNKLLKPTPPVREPDWLLETTKELAKAIHRDNYPDVPQWEVFNDLPGVISQIDNMVCGMERKKPVREPLSDAQINEIRLVHGVTSSGRGIREVAQVISFARAIEAITKEQK